MQDDIRNAVLKVALGFSVEEVTEEYGVEDGELKLVKRKEKERLLRELAKTGADREDI